MPPSLSSSIPVGALFWEPGSVLTTKLLLLVWTHQHSSLVKNLFISLDHFSIAQFVFSLTGIVYVFLILILCQLHDLIILSPLSL